MDRRTFLATSLAGAFAAVAVPLAQGAPKTRVVLLGTSGGPSPKRPRSAPANAVVVGDAVYIVDCGDGVSRQIALARLPFNRIRAVFITHQHSDHNADYGNLLLFAWVEGLSQPVETFGPPPLERMTRLFLEMNELDIRTRIKDEGRPPIAPLIRAHDLTEAGIVFKDTNVAVRAALNHHPPMDPSFAYRFDSADRSIVFSGDTGYSESVARLAADADVLVHEVIYPPAVEGIARRFPGATRLREHLIDSHTTPEQLGRLASEARVKTLVLSHLVPGGDEQPISDEMWTAPIRRHFGGKIIVGTDLMEI
jgi:ribonuclease BN (tRNA processing enzyme)